MDFFKKKQKISGNYIANQEIDVQSVPESDAYSNIYSELEDTDKANMELLRSLITKYKNTKVVENLNIEPLEQDLIEQRIQNLNDSQNIKISESAFQNGKSNLTFQQPDRLFKQKVKTYNYQDNKELVMQVTCLQFLYKNFLIENKKRARQYLENRLLDKELRKNLAFLSKKKQQLENEKKNMDDSEKEKYSIENLDKAISNMKENLDRVSGKNSMKKFLKKVDNKTDVFIEKNYQMEKKIDLILKDFDQIRENLLEIIVELN